ncbi:MAG: thioredoxin family protein [Prevotella sp.]|nr:thioredoxin family protein [Prevotella sp.]
MKKRLTMALLAALMALTASAQATLKKVYDENINPLEQIDKAVAQAAAEGKHVICQIGGNWCPWCLRLADFIASDSTISQTVSNHFVYIHVNYDPRKKGNGAKARQAAAMMKRLGSPRHGFPVLVVLDKTGKVIHTQETGSLEKEKSYDRQKVLQFFLSQAPKIGK